MTDTGPKHMPDPTVSADTPETGPVPQVDGGWILADEESIRAEARAFGEERRRRRRSLRLHVLSWVAVLAGAICLGLLIRTYVVQTFYVPSGSMVPTLLVGDRILVDKLPVVSQDIHRGDIIVFRRVARDTDPSKPANLVKRVIGLPGETISSSGDTVLINGRQLAEPWLPDLKKLPKRLGCYSANLDITKTKIPQGQYYVLGDCRGNSSDSRFWGPVPASHIIGKVFLVVWRNGHPWFHWF
jgi:signal peptidase I